jgi:signal peptidase
VILVLRLLLRAVQVLFALTVLMALVVLIGIPRATHGQTMTVLTGSMSPGIPVGSSVVVRPVDPATLQVGDVATYQKTPGRAEYVTHRIVKIDASRAPTRYTFKGDANRTPDIEPVLAKQIRGQVWFHVPHLGAIRDSLHGQGGITLVAMLLLAGYALSQIRAGLRERKEERSGRPLALPTDRPLLVVTLAIDRLSSRLAVTPAELAAVWRAVLVHQDDESCTLVLAEPSRAALAARVEVVASLQPLRLLVLDGPITLTGEATSAAVRPDKVTRADAWAG